MPAVNTAYDVIVIGGGHAGAEAAWAATSLGARTALVTLSRETIAAMSCNPAIGGVGKGQIVREIDALGGLMARAADATGIQFRMLNASKGPAVRGPRCQSDRHAYAAWVREALEGRDGLEILEGEALAILRDGQAVRGVRFAPAGDGEAEDLPARVVIVTAGTFLNGLMHCGERTWPGGRYEDPAAGSLSGSLRDAGLTIDRLKTGTCPRIAADSIDTSRCTRQDGDEHPQPFSFLTGRLDIEQTPCWLTHTTEAIHQIVRENFHRAPLYTGQIRSTGPRYCPSFETKVERFAEKTSHLVFLEPEGRQTDWVYCNGISTSLPEDVQEAMVHGIPGLEDARILRYGYAIEYDFFQPTQCRPSLETKAVEGLYLAGQVIGTTGYEEAGALGLLAGLNAVRRLRGSEPVILRRSEAYIGVMIDDLVTKGVTEPYRMFTSRAEYRLSLRADNADRRLTPLGMKLGLVDGPRQQRFEEKSRAAEAIRQAMQAIRVGSKNAWDAMREPNATLADVLARAEGPDSEELHKAVAADPEAAESVSIDAAYAGYLQKQAQSVRHLEDLDAKRIPEGFRYAEIGQLRFEAREKLQAVEPATLGQALRISGITPADIAVLSVQLQANRQQD